MKINCENCGSENPKPGMKTCSRKCADEIKKKNSREQRICLYCNNSFEIRKKDSKKLCSEVCRKAWSDLPENIDARIRASQKAIKEQFGVENIFQLASIKKKSKETKIERYGDENYNNPDKMTATKKKNYGEDYGKEWYKKVEKKLIETYGVTHGLQIDEFLKKRETTNIIKYGTESVFQNDCIKQAIINKVKEKFGVENVSQNEKVKQKKKDTSLKNFGVEHHLKDHDMFQKHQKARFNIRTYKNSGLNYNGSYEKYFLELLEEQDLLNEVQPGQSFEYQWNNGSHVYHADFFFRGRNIEIKSEWTYNKNGADQELQNLNEAKWEAVRSQDAKILVLIGKSEIRGFIKSLI